jgi:drug/metabolite transporter (DMT)-like permease
VLAPTLLALASAGLHAAWNLRIKTSADREIAAWIQFAAGGLLFVPVLLFVEPPGAGAWPYLAASGCVHLVYVAALVSAYHHGDFSVAYPLARGGGALAAAVLGALALGDDLGGGAWLSIVVVALGLAAFVRPGAPRAELGFALLTAATIGSYTVLDAAGAREAESGFAYGITLSLVTGAALSVLGVSRGRGADFVRAVRDDVGGAILSGFLLTSAYSLVLVAVRLAPTGYVAMLRESSVVLAALLGWIVLHEPFGARRFAASLVVVGGLVALIATG